MMKFLNGPLLLELRYDDENWIELLVYLCSDVNKVEAPHNAGNKSYDMPTYMDNLLRALWTI